jgi:hypothetical protein
VVAGVAWPSCLAMNATSARAAITVVTPQPAP